MNFDHYANHIVQKYRLVVAVAIVKNTPENYTPQRYFEKLKTNVISKMESYEDDITIYEDDFDFDDEDNDCTNDDENEQASNDQNLNQDHYDGLLNDSTTILKDFDFDEMIRNLNNDNHRDATKSDSVQDAIRILKSDNSDFVMGEKVVFGKKIVINNLNNSQSTYYDSSQSLISATNISTDKNDANQNDIRNDVSNPESFKTDNSKCTKHNKIDDKEKCVQTHVQSQEVATLHDSQKTGLNTLYEFTDHLTHVSQSQGNNIVLSRYLLDKVKQKDVSTNTVDATKECAANRIKNMTDNVNDDRIDRNDTSIIQDLNFETRKMVENKNSNRNTDNLNEVCGLNFSNASLADILKQVKDHKRPNYDTLDNIENSEAKRIRNIDTSSNSCPSTLYYNEMGSLCHTKESDNSLDFNFSLSNTTTSDSSQTRADKLMPDRNYIYRSKNNPDANTVGNETEFEKSDNSCESRTQNTISLKTQGETIQINYNGRSFFRFSQEIDSEDSNVNKHANDEVNLNNDTTNQETVVEAANDNREVDMEELDDLLTDSQTELVPFKVIEELNKIKAYLNKRDRKNNSDCVSDSGYKSDSQSKTSFKSALHSTNAWLDQSAHTLVSFVVRCSFVANTADITNEISRTLGQLIDKLHEEEKYPSFLEEHLATVENLLQEVFEGVENDMFMKKDVIVHRIFLLNKSSHIIKYTIEKIMAILEDVHSKLTLEDSYELSHINQFENVPHIFHILETLIKRIIVFNKFLSQTSTQNSQDDDGILKKSSITDIWRKKWNLSKKTEVDTNVNTGKHCILENCSHLLNKIIVQAMDGYSLISFYALQCFNLLQN